MINRVIDLLNKNPELIVLAVFMAMLMSMFACLAVTEIALALIGACP